MTVAFTLGGVGLTYVLVRVIAWRLGRGPRAWSRRWWPLVPLAFALAAAAWWSGYPDLSRWVAALTAGAPFLLATERTWARFSRVDLHVDCWHCELERLIRC